MKGLKESQQTCLYFFFIDGQKKSVKKPMYILIYLHFNAGLLSLFQTCHEAIS